MYCYHDEENVTYEAQVYSHVTRDANAAERCRFNSAAETKGTLQCRGRADGSEALASWRVQLSVLQRDAPKHRGGSMHTYLG
jgi:hypothetical protein